MDTAAPTGKDVSKKRLWTSAITVVAVAVVATVVVAVASAEVISTKIINRIEIRIYNALALVRAFLFAVNID